MSGLIFLGEGQLTDFVFLCSIVKRTFIVCIPHHKPLIGLLSVSSIFLVLQSQTVSREEQVF